MLSPSSERAMLLAGFAGLVLLAGCGSQSGAGIPRPAPFGTASGRLMMATIGVGGNVGTPLLSPDGNLSLTVPAGAVSQDTQFTIDVVAPDTAPGAVGSAYRLGPSGLVLARPVTLTFTVPAGASAPSALTAAFQDPSGFWLRVAPSALTAGTTTVAAATTHFSDWSLTTLNSAQDMSGTFTVQSTLMSAYGESYSVTGSADLTYSAYSTNLSYYTAGGAMTMQTASFLINGLTCVPVTPSQDLITNIVEASTSPAIFEWSVSADFTLSCITSTGGAAPDNSAVVAFDTFGNAVADASGATRFDCTRTYPPDPTGAANPLVTSDQIKGNYVITCGTDGSITGTWNFCTSAVATCPSSCATPPCACTCP